MRCSRGRRQALGPGAESPPQDDPRLRPVSDQARLRKEAGSRASPPAHVCGGWPGPNRPGRRGGLAFAVGDAGRSPEERRSRIQFSGGARTGPELGELRPHGNSRPPPQPRPRALRRVGLLARPPPSPTPRALTATVSGAGMGRGEGRGGAERPPAPPASWEGPHSKDADSLSSIREPGELLTRGPDLSLRGLGGGDPASVR